MKRMDKGIQKSACIFTIKSFVSIAGYACITIQSNIVYNIINDKNMRYVLLVLLFFVLLATYPNTTEFIIVAITTKIMLKGLCIISVYY